MRYLEGKSMNVTSLTKKVWISVGSTEMTPLEQRCKNRHYSEVQTLKHLNFPFTVYYSQLPGLGTNFCPK